MRLRFFTSHCRKNSARDKVIGNKWIYLKRYTWSNSKGENGIGKNALFRVWAISEGVRP